MTGMDPIVPALGVLVLLALIFGTPLLFIIAVVQRVQKRKDTLDS